MLTNHEIGRKALNSRKLLNEVIKIKKTFYDSGFARYDDCINGNLRLIPGQGYLELLKEDFNKMLRNKMFYGDEPNFDSIIGCVRKLEKEINTSQ